MLFQNVRTEYNDFNVISIISTPLFLISQSKLTHPLFLKSQQVIGTNCKYTRGFENHSYICRCPGLSNRCSFGLANQMAGRFSPATELEINRFLPSSFRYIMWHLSTQVNNALLSSYITIFTQGGISAGASFPV